MTKQKVSLLQNVLLNMPISKSYDEYI